MLERGIASIHFQDEEEFVKIMDTIVGFGEPVEVLSLVSTWKEGGNFLFKNGQSVLPMISMLQRPNISLVLCWPVRLTLSHLRS